MQVSANKLHLKRNHDINYLIFLPNIGVVIMRKKFLETRASREKFVRWVIASVCLLLLTVVVLIAFADSDRPFIEDYAVEFSSSSWWVFGARVAIAVIALAVVLWAVVIVGIFVFIGVVLAWQFLEDNAASIRRFVTTPYRVISNGIQEWIDSGVK